jgi:hypothetical protein
MRGIDLVFPEPTDVLRAASTEQRRSAALAACEFATVRAPVDEPIVARAIRDLRAGLRLTDDTRKELDALAEHLDDEYFDLRDEAEAGRASEADWLPLFEKARAVSALSSAGHSDSLEAASEAIYEAAATVDEEEKKGLLELVRAAMEMGSQP